MTKELAATVMIAVAVALVAIGVWAWWRRMRRDRGFVPPVGELPAADTTLTARVLYVATTRRDEPMERLALRGLGFRSPAEVTVTASGVALDLAGQPRVAIERSRIVAVDQATLAIDKVVERDGLVRLTWTIDAAETTTPVDTYLRTKDRSARSLVDAIAPLVASTPDTTRLPSEESE